MDKGTLKELHITISGWVQGVSFRIWTKRLAQQLGVNGWVRNMEDGRVEIVAQGTPEQLTKLRKLIKEKGGPRIADIASIEVKERIPLKRYPSFEIEK